LPRVEPFTKALADEAGALLAARHTRERERFPILPARFEDPAACAELVRSALDHADGVAAFDARNGRLGGFLLGFQNLPDPSSPSARYAPERSSMLIAHGHALAHGADAAVVYPALFAELAEQCRRQDITDHFAHVPAGDAVVLEAWFELGFGRANAVAARDLRPVEAPVSAVASIRAATPDDLDVVDRLVDEESRFHATSPIMRPYLREQTKEAVRRNLEAALAAGESVHLIARVDGADAGVIEIGPSRGSPLYIPDGAAYIGDTAVLPQARGTGIGAALVSAALAWGRERGFQAATLHFATANALSRAFWTDLGFEPVMWHLRRRLDERIVWAQPPEASA
jgi:GNAT superfamily N-acetyltransferase